MADGGKEWKNGNRTNKREQDVKQPEDREKTIGETLNEWKRHIKGASIISRGTQKQEENRNSRGLFSSLHQKLAMEAAASRPFATESL